MATRREPKQIDPKLNVEALEKESIIATEQKELASWGANHQVPTVPATVATKIF